MTTRKHLTKTDVLKAVAPPGTNPKAGHVIHDDEVPGLTFRVYPNGNRSWWLYYRSCDGRQRRYQLPGGKGLMPDAARKLARETLGDVAHGRDPSAERASARDSDTVAQLCERYLELAEKSKRPASVAMDRRNVERFIVPRWGKLKVASIGARDAEQLHASMSGTPVLANRVRALVSHMFSMAERWRLHPGPNPARHVERYPEKPVHNPIGDLGLRRLGTALDALRDEARVALEHRGRHSTNQPLARDTLRGLDAIELLALTGCRRSEIVALRWSEVDLPGAAIHLAQDKAGGGRTVWLGPEAVTILARQERPAGPPGLVFPGRVPGLPLQGIEKLWQRVRVRAELPGVRLHDLRHSVGAAAASAGMGQAAIAALLGHRNTRTTDRYTRPHQDPARAAAEQMGAAIAGALRLPKGEEVEGVFTVKRTEGEERWTLRSLASGDEEKKR